MLATLKHIIGSSLTAKHAAWLCVGVALVLSLIGIYVIDVGVAPPPSSSPGSILPVTLSQELVFKQIVFLGVGLLAAALVALPHYRFVRLLAWPAMAVVVLLLIFLLMPGVPASIVTPRNGARAWIDLGPFDLQPAELAKIAFILVIADYLRLRGSHRRFLGLVPPAMIAFIPVGLIMLQPDLGTAILFVPTLFAMLVAAGAKISHMTIIVACAALAVPAAYPLLKPHQKQRIVGLIHLVQGSPEGADDINFQSLTAQRLAGAGGFTGTPDAKSRALVRFNRLPERHNDMVFAVLVNRFGLRGGLAVLALYGVYFFGAVVTAASCRDPFGRLVVVGCTALLAAQMFINLGMTTGFLPIIGLTLPFVSYGGSSMLSVWVMTGLIFAVACRRPARMTRPAFEFGDDAPGIPADVPAYKHRIPPHARPRATVPPRRTITR